MKDMFRKLTISALGALLLTGSFASAATERPMVTAGSRSLSPAEYAEINERRVEEEPKAEALVVVEEEVAVSAAYSTHAASYHQPISVSLLGDTVELEDGSIWTVKPSDRWKTLDWFVDDLITIHENDAWFSSYQFRMVNENTGDSVQVNLSFEPIYNGVFTYWVVAIDYDYNQVCLNDGSIWDVSALDGYILDRWFLNDTIIVGSNDSWFSMKSNILINATTLTTVRADCTF